MEIWFVDVLRSERLSRWLKCTCLVFRCVQAMAPVTHYEGASDLEHVMVLCTYTERRRLGLRHHAAGAIISDHNIFRIDLSAAHPTAFVSLARNETILDCLRPTLNPRNAGCFS